MKLLDGDQQPEGYVDRREMARRLGVSVSLLDKMVSRNEVPSVTWGGRTRRFLPSAVMAAADTPGQGDEGSAGDPAAPTARTLADPPAMPLSLSRTAGESIVLTTREGQEITVTVKRLEVSGDGARTARIEVAAPRDVEILRGELS